QQVAALIGDDSLNRLRAAYPGSDTPAPIQSPSSATSRAPSGPAATTPPEIANVPQELANHAQYEVLRELGRGGMGVVYLARNRLMDRLEVLKVINPTLV